MHKKITLFSLALSLAGHLFLLMPAISLKNISHFSKVSDRKIKIAMVVDIRTEKIVVEAKRDIKFKKKKSVEILSKKKIEQKTEKQKQIGNFKKLLDDSGQSSITAKYITMVRNIIEKKKFYPFVARKRELEGSVTIKMTIKSTGEIIGASIIKASVHKILNEAALATVHKVEKFPSFPSSIKKSFIDITIPLVYKLI